MGTNLSLLHCDQVWIRTSIENIAELDQYKAIFCPESHQKGSEDPVCIITSIRAKEVFSSGSDPMLNQTYNQLLSTFSSYHSCIIFCLTHPYILTNNPIPFTYERYYPTYFITEDAKIKEVEKVDIGYFDVCTGRLYLQTNILASLTLALSSLNNKVVKLTITRYLDQRDISKYF